MQQPSLEQWANFVECYQLSMAHEHSYQLNPIQQQQLQGLEALIGQSLLSAQGRPSELAEQLYQRLHSLPELMTRPSVTPENQQDIVIAIDPLITNSRWLSNYPRLVAALQVQSLQLLSLAGDELDQALNAQQADIVIRLNKPAKPATSASRYFGSLSLVLAAAPRHPLSKRAQLGYEQLLQYRQLKLSGLPQQFHLNHYDYWQLEQRDLLEDLLVLGEGWAIAPRHYLEASLQQGRLQELKLDNHYLPLRLELELLWPAHRSDANFTHCLSLLGVNDNEF